MHDNIHAEYGNAGHRFPRTTGEAFGPGACVFVATDCDEDDAEYVSNLSTYFAIVVYTIAAIVVGVILLG